MVSNTVDWLVEGDPAIRWQTMRDLVGATEAEWQAERAKIGTADDWAGRLLSLQDPAGSWGHGVYSPKWTSTTYTLMTLIECGLDAGHPDAVRGARFIFDRSFTAADPEKQRAEMTRVDFASMGSGFRSARRLFQATTAFPRSWTISSSARCRTGVGTAARIA